MADHPGKAIVEEAHARAVIMKDDGGNPVLGEEERLLLGFEWLLVHYMGHNPSKEDEGRVKARARQLAVPGGIGAAVIYAIVDLWGGLPI